MKKLTEQEIIETVNGIFAETFELDAEKLTPDAKIFEELGLDSLDAVDLVAGLQEKFNVSLRNDERVRAVRTLSDVYALVAKLQDEMTATV
jgi:acyl carrier protein